MRHLELGSLQNQCLTCCHHHRTNFKYGGPPPNSSTSFRTQKLRRKVSVIHASIRPPEIPVPSTSGPALKRLAIFVSGGGSNFKAIHSAILEGKVNAEVAMVVTNAPSCGGADYARAQGIPVLVHPPPKANPSAGLNADDLVSALVEVSELMPRLTFMCRS